MRYRRRTFVPLPGISEDGDDSQLFTSSHSGEKRQNAQSIHNISLMIGRRIIWPDNHYTKNIGPEKECIVHGDLNCYICKHHYPQMIVYRVLTKSIPEVEKIVGRWAFGAEHWAYSTDFKLPTAINELVCEMAEHEILRTDLQRLISDSRKEVVRLAELHRNLVLQIQEGDVHPEARTFCDMVQIKLDMFAAVVVILQHRLRFQVIPRHFRLAVASKISSSAIFGRVRVLQGMAKRQATYKEDVEAALSGMEPTDEDYLPDEPEVSFDDSFDSTQDADDFSDGGADEEARDETYADAHQPDVPALATKISSMNSTWAWIPQELGELVLSRIARRVVNDVGDKIAQNIARCRMNIRKGSENERSKSDNRRYMLRCLSKKYSLANPSKWSKPAVTVMSPAQATESEETESETVVGTDEESSSDAQPDPRANSSTATVVSVDSLISLTQSESRSSDSGLSDSFSQHRTQSFHSVIYTDILSAHTSPRAVHDLCLETLRLGHPGYRHLPDLVRLISQAVIRLVPTIELRVDDGDYTEDEGDEPGESDMFGSDAGSFQAHSTQTRAASQPVSQPASLSQRQIFSLQQRRLVRRRSVYNGRLGAVCRRRRQPHERWRANGGLW